MANLFYGIDSDQHVAAGCTATIKSHPATQGLKVDRFVVEEAHCWIIRSLRIGGRELMVHGAMSAAAFIGNHPLLIEAECCKGQRVVIQVTNLSGACYRFLGVLSGPELCE